MPESLVAFASHNTSKFSIFLLAVFQASSGLLWVLYDLANNPKVQDKVCEEVTSLIGPHGDFTPESFAKLDYIKACVKETLR